MKVLRIIKKIVLGHKYAIFILGLLIIGSSGAEVIAHSSNTSMSKPQTLSTQPSSDSSASYNSTTPTTTTNPSSSASQSASNSATSSSNPSVQSQLTQTEQAIDKEAEVCPGLQSSSQTEYSSDESTAENQQIAFENSLPNYLENPTSLQEIQSYTDQLNSQLESDYNQISSNLQSNGCFNGIYELLLYKP